MGHIVVGVDETPEAISALVRAAEEAAIRGSRLTAVLAWDYLSQHHGEPTEVFDPQYSEADAHRALAEILNRTLGLDPLVPVERRVVCDLPARALIEAAGDADLLVVGCRDLHGLRHPFSRSVSARCRKNRPCPMLIVHSDGHDERFGWGATAEVEPSGA